ncbi:monooxygenase [Xylariales sp. AK1849]|nr:monooxygenase [Xylariales sp. AK1849]
MVESFDFVIIGAGISGVDAAYRLKTQLPNCSFTILEGRDKIGGTWSFFKFPGLRSDSQLAIFGFSWRPWVHEKDIASADLIVDYVESAARDEGIDKKIQFDHKVKGANWSSEEQQWTLDVDAKDLQKTFRATFILNCTGYYNYQQALKVTIPGIENFRGVVAHPQFWPDDLSFSGKRVVLVGSGATAVTMLPILAETAGHVTLLQRSPSYVASVPSVSPVGMLLKTYLPVWLAHSINWWRCFLTEQLFVSFILAFPSLARSVIMSGMRKQLPDSIPVDVHFNPRYVPMEQRLGLCPDGNFFKALHRDNCDIVTDVINTVTPGSIRTKSGLELDADIIVTATGLHVELLSGIVPNVDGVPVDIGSSYTWRGSMLTGLPNLGSAFGYTTNSWTLGADASIRLTISVYKYMRKIGATSVVPVFDGGDSIASKPVVSASSTYFLDARGRLPRVTGKSPWYGRVNPVYDFYQLWFGSRTKGMKYTVPSKKES